MATDMYDDGGSDNPGTPSKAEKKDKGAATALLPTSFFPERPEVGKTCTIRTTRVMDDQVEVEYVHSESSDEVEVDEEEVAVEEPMSDLMA